MHIILGATGQIGSMLVSELLLRGEKVRVVIRDTQKVAQLKDMGAEVFIADYTDAQALINAFDGCESAFLITPENPFSEDYLSEVSEMLACYKEAVLLSGIKEVTGLSSMGAQHSSGTGNLTVSNQLEKLFTDTNIHTAFIRPAYYFSNWMGYYDTVKENGILPSFFPSQLKIPMIAPCDVAYFAADVITRKIVMKPLFEIYNDYYCAEDIADIMGIFLSREVAVMEISQSDWLSTLKQVGFSDSGASNLALMTEAVVSGKTKPETELIRLSTDFQSYLNKFSAIT